MVTHLVLFAPKPTLSADARAGFVAALAQALQSIPGIRRARIGRRVTLGRPYDALNAQDFPYAAILEFDSMDDLRGYLDHPAHLHLGAQFYQSADRALVFDFELLDGERVGDLLAEDEVLERQQVEPGPEEDPNRITR